MPTPSDNVTVTVTADSPQIHPSVSDPMYVSEAHRFAEEARASAVSAGKNREAIEAILAQVADGAAFVSSDESNRLKRGTDGGLYVSDDLIPDPLAYFNLAKD